jgi:uncharacterized protein YjbI with pentapeptide repeats
MCWRSASRVALRAVKRIPRNGGISLSAASQISGGATRLPSVTHLTGGSRRSRIPALRLVAAALLGSILSQGAQADCKDNPGPGIDWHGCNKQLLQLENADLAGANFSGAFLSGTRFSGAKLDGADLQMSELVRTSFDNADLSGANLEKALAARASFKSALLKGARLIKAEFQRVNFEGADLSDSSIEEAELMRNDFTSANLANANLAGATLARTIFRGATLTGASFKRAYLYWARFEDTDLTAVKDLTQAQLDMACGDERTKLPAGLTKPKNWPCGED